MNRKETNYEREHQNVPRERGDEPAIMAVMVADEGMFPASAGMNRPTTRSIVPITYVPREPRG